MGVRQSIRVMKGQKAAMYGLMLAGIPYLVSCKIVGVHHERMQPYVARDWRRGRHPIPLKELPRYQRKAYEMLRNELGPAAAYAQALTTKRKRAHYRYSSP